MTKQLMPFVTISALLFVGATRGWAGPGDIDPNFGNGGRVELLNEISLLLPDDRLMVAYNAGNLIVARFDANGKVDPTFGEGGPTFSDAGETRVPLPDAWPRFYAYFGGVTPDGGLVFAGPLRDFERETFIEAVLRLDRDGHVVTSFGGHGDGYYRLKETASRYGVDGAPSVLMGLAVDANGRVLLAERSWTADGRCGGPTSVLRLTPGGKPDAAFGENGRAAVPGVDVCGGSALFGARQDGSIVIGARGAIVGLDASGALDPGFGVGGHVSLGLPEDWGRGVLLPDGSILIVGRDSATTSNAVITRFNRGGALDSTFGAGTGSMQLDPGAAFFGISGSRQSIHDFVLAPDAAHVYLKLAVLLPDGTTACAGGIARVSVDGKPDVSFGRQGLTCLDFGVFPFVLVGTQRNGSPLFESGHTVRSVYRLLMDETASPGMIMLRSAPSARVGEADGVLTMPVVRTAGHDGAVSVSFSTGPRLPDPDDGNGSIVSYGATEGRDFLAASGQLGWADGDEAERKITVTILDDEIDDDDEHFSIGISEPQGGALLVGQPIDVGMFDDDEASPPTAQPPTGTPPTTTSGSGGGGSLSAATLLVLSGLLLGRRRRGLTTLYPR